MAIHSQSVPPSIQGDNSSAEKKGIDEIETSYLDELKSIDYIERNSEDVGMKIDYTKFYEEDNTTAVEKPRSEMDESVLSKATNPRTSLVNIGSYHGYISGREAINKLQQCAGHCYLIRFSKERECFILGVKFPEGDIQHIKICEKDGKISLDADDNVVVFDSFHHLLDYYKVHPLTHDINSTLGRPCQRSRKECCVVL